MGVEPKIGVQYPKMDGENNGKPYEQMDDWGGKPTIFGNIQIEKNKPNRNMNSSRRLVGR